MYSQQCIFVALSVENDRNCDWVLSIPVVAQLLAVSYIVLHRKNTAWPQFLKLIII